MTARGRARVAAGRIAITWPPETPRSTWQALKRDRVARFRIGIHLASPGVGYRATTETRRRRDATGARGRRDDRARGIGRIFTNVLARAPFVRAPSGTGETIRRRGGNRPDRETSRFEFIVEFIACSSATV